MSQNLPVSTPENPKYEGTKCKSAAFHEARMLIYTLILCLGQNEEWLASDGNIVGSIPALIAMCQSDIFSDICYILAPVFCCWAAINVRICDFFWIVNDAPTSALCF